MLVGCSCRSGGATAGVEFGQYPGGIAGQSFAHAGEDARRDRRPIICPGDEARKAVDAEQAPPRDDGLRQPPHRAERMADGDDGFVGKSRRWWYGTKGTVETQVEGCDTQGGVEPGAHGIPDSAVIAPAVDEDDRAHGFIWPAAQPLPRGHVRIAHRTALWRGRSAAGRCQPARWADESRPPARRRRPVVAPHRGPPLRCR